MMPVVITGLTESTPFPIHLEPDACLRSRDRLSTCALCLDACPANALHWDQTITLDTAACAACGLCLHLCPVGAFSGEAGESGLLRSVARLEGMRTIELACSQHPQPQIGPGEVDAALRVNGCLAALGPSVYASLFALGIASIAVRLDSCSTCPIGQVVPHIRQNLDKARRVLWPSGLDEQITTIERAPQPDDSPRQVYETTGMPVSRRRLLRMFTPPSDSQPAEALLPKSAPPVRGEKGIPPERVRLLAALDLLPPPEPHLLCPAPLAGQNFARITANDDCTACGVCVQACPTGALHIEFEDSPQTFRLLFSPAPCTGCDICLHLCDPRALARGPVISFAELRSAEWTVIASGDYQRCQKCGARFAGPMPPSGLCPVCAFRRANPFGPRPPRPTAGRSSREENR